MAADIYERIRDAVRDAVQAVSSDYLDFQSCDVHAFESFDPNRANLPAIAVTYEGGAVRFSTSTNLSDYVVYPLLLGYYGVGPVNDQDQRPGPTLTRFVDVARALFHRKKLTALLDEVIECEIDLSPIINPQLPQFEKLLVAVGVNVTAKVAREITSS